MTLNQKCRQCLVSVLVTITLYLLVSPRFTKKHIKEFRGPLVFLIFSPFVLVIKTEQEIRNPAVGEVRRVAKPLKAKTFRPRETHMRTVAVYDYVAM